MKNLTEASLRYLLLVFVLLMFLFTETYYDLQTDVAYENHFVYYYGYIMNFIQDILFVILVIILCGYVAKKIKEERK